MQGSYSITRGQILRVWVPNDPNYHDQWSRVSWMIEIIYFCQCTMHCFFWVRVIHQRKTEHFLQNFWASNTGKDFIAFLCGISLALELQFKAKLPNLKLTGIFFTIQYNRRWSLDAVVAPFSTAVTFLHTIKTIFFLCFTAQICDGRNVRQTHFNLQKQGCSCIWDSRESRRM